MWQRPANTIPQLTRKGYQPHGFVWGAFFLIPQLVGIACGIIRGVVWCIWQKLRWDRVCVYVAVWHTLSWIETALQLVWRDSTPNWILDGFKFQASTVSVWWAMGEGGSSTIKLACAVKTLVFLTTNYHWQMRVPRLTRFALTTWSISTFTCKYYPFDSSNGFWEINMI